MDPIHLTCASQVKYWRNQEDSEGRAQRVVVSGRENHTRLEGMKPDSHYLIEIRGYNSAGYGPASDHLQIHTKKPRMLENNNMYLRALFTICVILI